MYRFNAAKSSMVVFVSGSTFSTVLIRSLSMVPFIGSGELWSDPN
jgi:hypothetical protein